MSKNETLKMKSKCKTKETTTKKCINQQPKPCMASEPWIKGRKLPLMKKKVKQCFQLNLGTVCQKKFTVKNLLQNKVKIMAFKKEAKVVWFLGFFSFYSFKAIFKLKVVWQKSCTKLWILYFFDSVRGSNSRSCIYLCIVPINWAKLTRTKCLKYKRFFFLQILYLLNDVYFV